MGASKCSKSSEDFFWKLQKSPRPNTCVTSPCDLIIESVRVGLAEVRFERAEGNICELLKCGHKTSTIKSSCPQNNTKWDEVQIKVTKQKFWGLHANFLAQLWLALPCAGLHLKLWKMRWVLLLLLLVGLLTRLVDQRSLVSGIGSSLDLSWKAMKIKCQTSQPLLGQPSARQIEQIKFTFVFTVHIFLTQLLKSKRFLEN